MSYANLARSADPNRSISQRRMGSRSAIAPHRGDVTTARAAAHVRLQETKRIKALQAHAPSYQTAGNAAVPALISGIGRA